MIHHTRLFQIVFGVDQSVFYAVSHAALNVQWDQTDRGNNAAQADMDRITARDGLAAFRRNNCSNRVPSCHCVHNVKLERTVAAGADALAERTALTIASRSDDSPPPSRPRLSDQLDTILIRQLIHSTQSPSVIAGTQLAQTSQHRRTWIR